MFFSLCAAVIATDAVAAESAFAVDAGIGHTDNIGRTATNQQGAVISTVGTLFSFTDLTRRFEADISGNLEYQHYSVDTYSGQIVGTLNAQGKFIIVPERFEWKFSDNFGQTTQQQAEVITPANRENINFIRTGPLFIIPVGYSNRVTLEGTYSDVAYQYAELNSQRYRGTAAVEHELSTVSKVSLAVQSERISYQDAAVYPSINQQEAFIHYQAAGARTTLGLDVGYGRVKQDATTNNHPLFRLNATRVTSQHSVLSVFLSHQTADSGSLFQLLQNSPVANQTTQVVQPQNEFFTTTYGGVLWKLTQGRSSLEFSAARYKDTYQTLLQFDQTRTLVRGDVERQVTPTLQVYASAFLWTSKNAGEFGDTTDRNLVVGLVKRVGKRLSLDFQFDRLDRTADQAAEASKANQIWLRVYYGSSSIGSGSLAPGFL